MSYELTTQRTVERLKALWHDELVWMSPAFVAAALVYYAYVVTHPYPAFGAGLFLEIAEQISANGYALPERIPYYAPDGIPFAYPPFGFYVAAVLQDLFGVDPLQLSRYLPGFLTILYLVPAYFVGRELLGSKPQASLATLLLAISPPALQWHISAGGLVRTYAFLFVFCGTYTGIKLFRSRERHWIVPSLGAFALTLLSHPQYAVFFVLTYLVLFATFDRTLGGLLNGAVVGLGGIAITAPWWLRVMSFHGADVFTAAAGTHGGIGQAWLDLFLHFDEMLPMLLTHSIWVPLPVLGVAYLVYTERYFLPVWLAVTALALGNARFVFPIGAFAIAPLVFEVGLPAVRRMTGWRTSNRRLSVLTIGLVLVVGTATGALYAAGQVNAHAGSQSQPQFIDDNDVEAMNWVATETPPDAQFVVLGDAGEWFPYQTKRTLLVGPWGVEWKSSEEYERQLSLYKDVSKCETETCVTGTLSRLETKPSHVYVPTEAYTVRGMEQNPDGQLRADMVHSDRYELVFENDGVAIFAVK